ncbi:MAG: hypothetical protein WC869_10480 [Phycisphaerae bacterium]|jgi:hypothetical protein
MEIGERVRVVAPNRRRNNQEGLVVHISRLASNPDPIGVKFTSDPYAKNSARPVEWYSADELERI